MAMIWSEIVPLNPRIASSYSSTRALVRTTTRAAAAGLATIAGKRTRPRASSLRNTWDSSPHPAEDQLRVERLRQHLVADHLRVETSVAGTPGCIGEVPRKRCPLDDARDRPPDARSNK